MKKPLTKKQKNVFRELTRGLKRQEAEKLYGKNFEQLLKHVAQNSNKRSLEEAIEKKKCRLINKLKIPFDIKNEIKNKKGLVNRKRFEAEIEYYYRNRFVPKGQTRTKRNRLEDEKRKDKQKISKAPYN